ncbi:DUF3533 domain-containing protein [Paenibacillus sp. H1-7]|uniref:YhgE/Pip domain-containing protein n=1 Tax=Paenibacillus sp. H1-7 TaxID=2282849 RepID=UPI001EF8A9A9|nr:ABC transporter permease [Paenibacillus sp. H1-7]ULL18756.1 DUF3533 domain-containing protein [Paenibacillus sp. H1-7]
MLPALREYLKRPTTIIGIVTAMMFQIIFSVIWMTGYAGVTDNTRHLKIAVVNEDSGMGRTIAEKVKASLPFEIREEASHTEALAQLERRDVQMVLHIPADFTRQLQSAGQKGQIGYTINESNPALIKSIMQGVANGITTTVNKEAAAAGAQAVLAQTNMAPQQAQGIAQGIADKVQGAIEYTHPVRNMANQMIPMMLVLASFVGTMIMGMNLQQSTLSIPSTELTGKWGKFGARMIINIASSVVIALVGCSLVMALGGESAGGFVAMWLFQTLFLFTFMLFSQLFLLAFGMAGMLFNIAMLSVQLVSSGAMVPRELLSSFYLTLSDYLPATYAVEGMMNILFGGPGAGSDAGALAIIALVCGGLATAAVGLRKETGARTAPSRPELSRA